MDVVVEVDFVVVEDDVNGGSVEDRGEAAAADWSSGCTRISIPSKVAATFRRSILSVVLQARTDFVCCSSVLLFVLVVVAIAL